MSIFLVLLNAARGHAFPINCAWEDKADTNRTSIQWWRMRNKGKRVGDPSVGLTGKSIRKIHPYLKLLNRRNNEVFRTANLLCFQRLSGSFRGSFSSFSLLNTDFPGTVLGLLPFVLDSPHYSQGSSSLWDVSGAPDHGVSYCVSIKHWYDFELLTSHFHLGFLTHLAWYNQSEYQHPSYKPPLPVLPVC